MNNKSYGGRLYERVARDLSQQIGQGFYAIGQRLPAERELAQMYEVSRPTVREAVIALELDGLVEVRQGSGVYVIAIQPRGGKAGATDIGPFELLEARRAIESEACALAATRITDEQLSELDRLLVEMQTENARDVASSEDADRRFHLVIAEATQNSGMEAVIQLLWDARARSPQTQLLSQKAHAAGSKPRIDEHAAIIDALRSRSPDAARQAMRAHLTRVIEFLLEVTEFQEIERARAKVEEQRRRFVAAV